LTWKIETKPAADKILFSLDKPVQKRIKKFIDERLSTLDDPRSIGDPLSGTLGDYWRYRVGDYRLICDIQDNVVTILIVTIGNRREVYR
jgi:mRNA interferase RelE/StbE